MMVEDALHLTRCYSRWSICCEISRHLALKQFERGIVFQNVVWFYNVYPISILFRYGTSPIQYCVYWWPGFVKPGHQYLQWWLYTNAFPHVYAEIRIFRDIYVNTMAADTVIPCIASHQLPRYWQCRTVQNNRYLSSTQLDFHYSQCTWVPPSVQKNAIISAFCFLKATGNRYHKV